MSPKRKPSPESKARSTSSAKKPSVPRPHEMPEDVLEFITAVDEYKRLNGKPFPSWSEVFEILKGLGYERSPSA